MAAVNYEPQLQAFTLPVPTVGKAFRRNATPLPWPTVGTVCSVCTFTFTVCTFSASIEQTKSCQWFIDMHREDMEHGRDHKTKQQIKQKTGVIVRPCTQDPPESIPSPSKCCGVSPDNTNSLWTNGAAPLWEELLPNHNVQLGVRFFFGLVSPVDVSRSVSLIRHCLCIPVVRQAGGRFHGLLYPLVARLWPP